ncbi:MAG: SDR family NAD(P)-dependent oxidoreductase [Pseudomonadota bacterium]
MSLSDTSPSATLFAGLGRLGARAAALRRAAGGEVVGLNRSGTARSGIPALAADLTRALPEPLPPVRAVVITLAPPARDANVYRQTYVDGVRHLLAALPQSARRVIYVSSTVVYGEDRGGWIDLETAADGKSERARVQLEAERLVADAAPETCALRLGGIYGPGRDALIRRVKDAKPVQQRPPLYTNRVHELDAARLINHLLDLEEVPPVVLGVDHEPAPVYDVSAWLAAQLGAAPPAGKAGSTSGKRIRNTATLKSGFTFTYPDYRAGYGALISDAAGDMMADL